LDSTQRTCGKVVWLFIEKKKNPENIRAAWHSPPVAHVISEARGLVTLWSGQF